MDPLWQAACLEACAREFSNIPTLAAGLPWLDCATSRGDVIYVAAEGGSGLGQRVQAYCDSHELAAPEGIRFVREAVNLLESADVCSLLAVADTPALVVVDTLS